jgi:hypothetical protein
LKDFQVSNPLNERQVIPREGVERNLGRLGCRAEVADVIPREGVERVHVGFGVPAFTLGDVIPREGIASGERLKIER